MIDIFGLAVRAGLSANQLMATIFAYPTAASDLGYMLQGKWRCRVFETMGGTSHFALFVQLTFNGHEQASVSGLFTELTK